MRIPLNRHTIGAGAIVLLMLIIGIKVTAGATPSAEAAALRAAQARLEAMQEACEKIVTRVAACWTQDKSECKALEESKAWFKNEFGEYAELACPNARDPLTRGAGRE